ncbi:hypothetical protein Tco_1068028 [Tanacetum coccineum]|uniref:Reverse transcriptase Ty1/copia-type domain-containing protein n=1 Tax=Tanacetum coccineum TaxID=301880 RepID=A0ABQ5HEN5_9ASTR
MNGTVKVNGSAVVQNLKKQDNSDYVCINRDDCMSSDNLCVSNSMNDVKFCAKPKKNKSKKDIWKPTGKVFTQIGYIWRPTGSSNSSLVFGFRLLEQPWTKDRSQSPISSEIIGRTQTNNETTIHVDFVEIDREGLLNHRVVFWINKARWSARGYLKKRGIDLTESFFVELQDRKRIRIFPSLFAHMRFMEYTMDVKTAFLNAVGNDLQFAICMYARYQARSYRKAPNAIKKDLSVSKRTVPSGSLVSEGFLPSALTAFADADLVVVKDYTTYSTSGQHTNFWVIDL